MKDITVGRVSATSKTDLLGAEMSCISIHIGGKQAMWHTLVVDHLHDTFSLALVDFLAYDMSKVLYFQLEGHGFGNR